MTMEPPRGTICLKGRSERPSPEPRAALTCVVALRTAVRTRIRERKAWSWRTGHARDPGPGGRGPPDGARRPDRALGDRGLAADQAAAAPCAAAREALTASAYDVVLLDHHAPRRRGCPGRPRAPRPEPRDAAVVMLTASGPDRRARAPPSRAAPPGSCSSPPVSRRRSSTRCGPPRAARRSRPPNGSASCSPAQPATPSPAPGRPGREPTAPCSRSCRAVPPSGRPPAGWGWPPDQARGMRRARGASALGGRSTLEASVIAVRARVCCRRRPGSPTRPERAVPPVLPVASSDDRGVACPEPGDGEAMRDRRRAPDPGRSSSTTTSWSADSLVRVLSLEDDIEPVGSPHRWPARQSLVAPSGPTSCCSTRSSRTAHGVEAIGGLLAAHPEVQVVMLTASTSDQRARRRDGGRCRRLRLQDQRPRRARDRRAGRRARRRRDQPRAARAGC